MLRKKSGQSLPGTGLVKAATVGIALALLAGPATAQNVDLPTIDEVMTQLGYSEQDRDTLLSGGIVVTDLDRDRDDQLIAAAAMFLPVTPETLLTTLRSGDGLRGDPAVLAMGVLGPILDPAEWQDLKFDEGDRQEAARLLRFTRGSDFNLAEDEIAALRSKLDGVSRNDSAMLETVSAAYRDILGGRYEAYRQRGLDGVANYQHGGTTLEPASQLAEVANRAEGFLSPRFPDFWAAFSSFPEVENPDIVSGFYWVKKEVEGRPEFVLVHDMSGGGADYVLVSRREYFVGHTYESLQVIALALPVEGGIAVFYVNAAFTEQITGFFGGVAVGVGQGRMRSDLTEFFTGVRERQQN